MKKTKYSAAIIAAGLAICTVLVIAFEWVGVSLLPDTTNSPISQASGALECKASQSSLDGVSRLLTGPLAGFGVPQAPKKFGSVEFYDVEGQPRNLAQLRGRAVLLNVWATWCPPCREEMPGLNELASEFAQHDFYVLALSVDAGDIDRPAAFLQELGLSSLLLGHDPFSTFPRRLRLSANTTGLPMSFMIDKEGCEIFRLLGPADWSSDKVKELMEVVLRKEPEAT